MYGNIYVRIFLGKGKKQRLEQNMNIMLAGFVHRTLLWDMRKN